MRTIVRSAHANNKTFFHLDFTKQKHVHPFSARVHLHYQQPTGNISSLLNCFTTRNAPTYLFSCQRDHPRPTSSQNGTLPSSETLLLTLAIKPPEKKVHDSIVHLSRTRKNLKSLNWTPFQENSKGIAS